MLIAPGMYPASYSDGSRTSMSMRSGDTELLYDLTCETLVFHDEG